MIIKKHLLVDFSKPPRSSYVAVVDKNAVFLKFVVCSDGILIFYEAPEFEEEFREDIYTVITHEQEIPRGFAYVDILSALAEEDEISKLITFPMYKKLEEEQS